MTRLTAGEALRRMLAEAGVRVLFRERQAVPALTWPAADDSPPVEIAGLTEHAVLAMAGGYAQASGGLGVAVVPLGAEGANLAEPLLVAGRAGTPLLVLAAAPAEAALAVGAPPRPEPALAPAKLVVPAGAAADLPRAVRRAIQQALSPPAGPVLLLLPADLTAEVSERDLAPSAASERPLRPSRAAVAAATNRLLEAERPAMLVGGGVVEPNVAARLVRLAELLGAIIYDDPLTVRGRPSALTGHVLHGGPAPLTLPPAEEPDVLLVVGREPPASGEMGGAARLFQRARLVWFGAGWDPAVVTAAPPVLLTGDPLAGLDDLLVSLEAGRTAAHQSAARQRVRRASAGRPATSRASLPAAPIAAPPGRAAVLPPEAILIEESAAPAGHLGMPGYQGWSVGGAVGVALAWPTRPVVARLDRLSLLAGLPALWTAARYQVAVVYLVDTAGPPEEGIDALALARAFGIQADRLTAVEALGPALAAARLAGRPAVLEMPGDHPLAPEVATAREE